MPILSNAPSRLLGYRAPQALRLELTTTRTGNFSPSVSMTGGAVAKWTINGVAYNTNTPSVTLAGASVPVVLEIAAADVGKLTALTMSNLAVSGTISLTALARCTGLATINTPNNSGLVFSGTLSQLPASLTYLQANGTGSTLTGALADLPDGMTYLHLANVAGVSISGAIADLPAGMQRLYVNGIGGTLTGTLADMPASMTHLHSGQRTADVSGGSTAPIATGAQNIYLDSTGRTAAQVDEVLLYLYTYRNQWTFNAPVISIAGSNANPNGTYQNATPPTTGQEYRYKLINDPDGEGFKKWTVTV